MSRINTFIKNNIPLCVGTLGLAIVGYLGYRAVKWIIHKCKSEEKTEAAALSALSSSRHSLALENPSYSSHSASVEQASLAPENEESVTSESKSHTSHSESDEQASLAPENEESVSSDSDEEIEVVPEKAKEAFVPVNIPPAFQEPDSDERILKGQGDYIVYHIASDGSSSGLTEEEYDPVYKIIQDFAPSAILSREESDASELCAKREELIAKSVREIDPGLHVSFVPKTLYELVFIRKCIREDMKKNEICKGLNPDYKRKHLLGKKCWHLCVIKGLQNPEDACLKQLALRLNNALVKTLKPRDQGFTYQELKDDIEKEIQFLRAHYVNDSAPADCNWPGPTTNFSGESRRGGIQSMGVRDDAAARIILKGLALDCSKLAENAFILYRGSVLHRDNIVARAGAPRIAIHLEQLNGKDVEFPYSLSYGTSLFAGCVYDGGASAYYFMRNEPQAYALSIPFEDLRLSPFYIPPASTLAQLYGHGEVFHARSKVWDGVDINIRIAGVQGGLHDQTHLKSPLSKEELRESFERYKKKAILLNGATS